jgi:hypothetical protein
MKNYIFATIKLPLEIKKDGSIETHHDRVSIQFENCNALPEKQISNANYAFLMNNLMDLMNQQPDAGYDSLADDIQQSTNDQELDGELDQELDGELDQELDDQQLDQDELDDQQLDQDELDEDELDGELDSDLDKVVETTITASFSDDIDKPTQNNILLFIKKDELERRAAKAQNNNITFKKKRYNINRFSAKRR